MHGIRIELRGKERFTSLGVLVMWLFTISTVYGQQDAQYTQYMFNTQMINPAYTGSRDVTSMVGMHRAQWIGINGAPRTYNFAVSTRLNNERIGLGLSMLRDEIGPSIEHNFAIDFSYAIKLSRYVKLAFGLKGGLNVLDIDYTLLDINDSTDDIFLSNVRNRLTPLIGTGFYLHNDEDWYLGISSPNLIKTKVYNETKSSEVTEKLHVYFIAGYVFDLSHRVKMKPALMTKFVSGSPVGIDASANFLINEQFTLGASYRLNSAVSGLFSLNILPKIMLGYAYEVNYNRLSDYSSGTHEIFLRFDIFSGQPSAINPRFF